MKFFRFILAINFIFSTTGVLPIAIANAMPADHAIARGAAFYNSLNSAAKLFAMLKVGAREDDAKYLEGLDKQFKNYALPRLTVKGDAVYVEGLEDPLRGIDPVRRTFYYHGKKIGIDAKAGIKNSIQKLEKQLASENVSFLWRWLLPSANADLKDLALIGGGVFGALGIMKTISCFDSDGTKSKSGDCAMGVGMDALALVMLIYGLKKDDPPQQIACNGGTMTILGANGAPLGRIIQTPGGALQTTGPINQVPMPAATQIYSACGSPATLTTMNTALAPVVLPPVPYRVASVVPSPQSAVARPAILPMSTKIKPQTTSHPATGLAPAAINPEGGAAR